MEPGIDIRLIKRLLGHFDIKTHTTVHGIVE